MRSDLPSGSVTFLFTDIEGSTKLLHELGEEEYARALAEHRRHVREAFGRRDGVEVDTQGDAFFVAFPTAPGALEAAKEAQEALARGPIRVRMGLHTGTPHLTGEGYVGSDVHKGARIAAAGHGGQVLLSTETRNLVDAPMTDLGEHRLKDFDEPVPIFQLGRERFPPLKTISNTNLPRPASSFVGREREMAEVVSQLRDGTRLLTLSGPGGSGKTRLGIEAAAELVPDFKAGVFWVGLAPLRDPAGVTQEIARAIGAKDGLADHIGEREMLLLIDNLEQVIDAAPELAALLEACPALRLLVSSRELLRVRGEVEYPVLPLAEPEAVTLFCERSGLPPEATIAELCVRLDSLPLAVELAAARTRVLSPAQILERIARRLDLFEGGRDADPRQRTLRTTIAWSSDLLSLEDRRLFERLSVFTGGCTLEAAEDVADADLDSLQSLVEKSLLRFTNERYWMLETIREFASERLAASGDTDAIERRHAGWFLELAEEAEPHLFSASAGGWLDRLEGELDNIRTALGTLEASGETERVLRLVGSLAEFWSVKGHLTEGRRRIERALEADRRPTAARARALNGAADLAHGSGDDAAARVRAEEGLALNRTLGDTWGTADSLLLLGINHIHTGRLAKAEELIEQSVLLYRQLGDERNALEATRFLAWVYYELGDLARARALHEDNLRQARALGDKQIEGRSLVSLAGDALDEGRGKEAGRLLKDAYRVNRELGDDYFAPIIVCRLGHALAVEGKADPAAKVLSSGRALLEEIGASEGWIARTNEETRATALSELGEAAFAEAWEQGRTLTADEAVALALAAEVIAALSLATDLGIGVPLEHGLHSTLIAMRLVERAGLDAETASQAYYACLLFYVGCTANADLADELFGGHDILTTYGGPVRFGSRPEMLIGVMRAMAPQSGAWLVRAAKATSRLPKFARVMGAQTAAMCEVAMMLTDRLGLPADMGKLFAYVDERWDGKGHPGRVRREEIPLAVRIAQVARDAAFQRMLGGPDLAARVIRDRAGKAFDPGIAGELADDAGEILGLDDRGSAWDATLACEPRPWMTLRGDAVERALAAMGDFADLVSKYLVGHSRGVAKLASTAATRCGFDAAEVATVRRAAFVHDIGRVAVPVQIWQKPGELTSDEWERVRLHAYQSERILSRSPLLAALAPVATTHHEPVDGSGYHRGSAGPALTPAARLLAAADAFHAMTEPRPHRPALASPEAAEALGRETRAGRLDPEAVAAVLEAAGMPAPWIERPAGITEREAQVVGLLARGLQTKQIARVLGISVKTADRHIQNAYGKIGVSSRAAAALFAMQHGLAAWGELPIASSKGRS